MITSEQAFALAGGNPGALNALAEMHHQLPSHVLSRAIEIIESIPTLRGTNLYVLFNDICDGNASKMYVILINAPLSLIEDACERQDRSGKIILSKYL